MQGTVVELVDAQDGYYVTAYASSRCSPCVGYFKVFAERVPGYFSSGHCIIKGAGYARSDSPDEAARAALANGLKELKQMLMSPEEETAWVDLRYG